MKTSSNTDSRFTHHCLETEDIVMNTGLAFILSSGTAEVAEAAWVGAQHTKRAIGRLSQSQKEFIFAGNTACFTWEPVRPAETATYP